MAIDATPPSDTKRSYPHVEGIADWQAQQSIRLLWDRVAQLEGRLQGVEATTGDLVTAANQLETQLTQVDRKADEALAITQDPTGSGTGHGGGTLTLPDYSAIVQSVLARYNPVVLTSEEDTGKAQLTRAAAWEIFQVDPNIGLIAKTTGNNVLGYSTDKIVQKTNGNFADIASIAAAGVGTIQITAVWGPGVGDAALAEAFVTPTQALAETPGPMVLL